MKSEIQYPSKKKRNLLDYSKFHQIRKAHTFNFTRKLHLIKDNRWIGMKILLHGHRIMCTQVNIIHKHTQTRTTRLQLTLYYMYYALKTLISLNHLYSFSRIDKKWAEYSRHIIVGCFTTIALVHFTFLNAVIWCSYHDAGTGETILNLQNALQKSYQTSIIFKIRKTAAASIV